MEISTSTCSLLSLRLLHPRPVRVCAHALKAARYYLVLATYKASGMGILEEMESAQAGRQGSYWYFNMRCRLAGKVKNPLHCVLALAP